MPTDKTRYEIFLSYSRKDNAPVLPPDASDGNPPASPGWVTALRDRILEDHRHFSTEPLRIFLDASEIRDMDDWRHRILGALRQSNILLVCLSPNYFASPYCRWEWDEYLRRQVHQLMGAESVATVYFVEVPGSSERDNARWLDAILQGNFTDIRPWFPSGAEALRTEEVRKRVAKLGESLWERVQRARRAEGAPGNLRRQNPYFVGRRAELRLLHEQLANGAVGLVTAVHGLGGQGKTELAVAYAHGWADCYPAGLWVLGAEKKAELLPLIGELAYAPELGYRPTDAERNDPVLLGRAVLAELDRRAQAARDRDPDGRAAVLLILDNVSETALLSKGQLATLPRADWLRIIATTRLDAARLDPSGKSLAHIAVDSLGEEDALALVRDHQEPRDDQCRPQSAVPGADAHKFVPCFASAAEEAAAREIVRELGGFTLAVEQVAVYLGLHPEIAPSAYLAGLRARGLPSVDALARHADVRDQLLHQGKQLAVILESTLGLLDAPARTSLDFAALLPPDAVPWPWLKALVTARHPELAQFAPDEPDLWVAVRRRLEGLRLLTPGDHPMLARVHRLVAAHLAPTLAAEQARSEIASHLAYRARVIHDSKTAPANWELDTFVAAVPMSLASDDSARDLAYEARILSHQLIDYRGLPSAKSLLVAIHPVFERLAASHLSNTGWQHDLLMSHVMMGDVLKAQGDLAGALQAYRQAMGVAEHLDLFDPSDAGWQRDLSVCHGKIGSLLEAQGDLEGALKAYRRDLAITQRLALSDPSNTSWQSFLLWGHVNMGDVLKAQGDLAGALQAYREAMGVAERLDLFDPSDAGWQRDLSVCHGRIGSVLKALGDLEGALTAYRRDFEIIQRLAFADPSNTGMQYSLSLSYDHMGDVLLAQDDPAGALQSYREMQVILQRLALSDPSNAHWQEGLSVGHVKMGDVLQAQGDLAGALQDYREAIGVAERLSKSDPSNAYRQGGLAAAIHGKIVEVLRDQGDLVGALKHLHMMREIATSLGGDYPDNPELALLLGQASTLILSIRMSKLPVRLAMFATSGCLVLGAWKLVQVSPWFWFLSLPILLVALVVLELPLESRIMRSHLVRRYQARLNATLKRMIKTSDEKVWGNHSSRKGSESEPRYDKAGDGQDHLGDVLLDLNDLVGALIAYREALGVAERLVTSDPTKADWQHDMSSIHVRIGDVQLDRGNLAGALQAYRDAMGVAERLATSDPSNAGWQRDLSHIHSRIGDVLSDRGDLEGAIQARRASIRAIVRKRQAKSDPPNGDWQHDPPVIHSAIGDVPHPKGCLAGVLEAHREDMEETERLAKSDPSNAGWQRDLFMRFINLARLSEKSGHGDALVWWQKAFEQLNGMEQHGIMLPKDERYLQAIRVMLDGAGVVSTVWEEDVADAPLPLPPPEAEQPRAPAPDVVPTALEALKDGRLQDAVDALRPLVFPGDGVVMDHTAPLEARLAFLRALWLSNNVEAIAQHLPSLPEQGDPRVAVLCHALADWQRGLTWAQRAGLKRKPPLPDVAWS